MGQIYRTRPHVFRNPFHETNQGCTYLPQDRQPACGSIVARPYEDGQHCALPWCRTGRRAGYLRSNRNLSTRAVCADGPKPNLSATFVCQESDTEAVIYTSRRKSTLWIAYCMDPSVIGAIENKKTGRIFGIEIGNATQLRKPSYLLIWQTVCQASARPEARPWHFLNRFLLHAVRPSGPSTHALANGRQAGPATWPHPPKGQSTDPRKA